MTPPITATADQLYAFTERSAIHVHDGKADRQTADRLAFQEVFGETFVQPELKETQ